MTAPDADRAVVDQLAEVWGRLTDLGGELTEAEWKRPTAVPGWSVQDNLTHLTDIEAMSMACPAPTIGPRRTCPT